jgi:hypothetical protein
MRRLLVRLFPGAWRSEYGEGFAELLDHTPLSPAVVLDCLRSAAMAHVRAHCVAVVLVAAAVWFAAMNVVAIRTGITVNILWAPTSVRRGLMLMMTLGPPLALVRQARCLVAAA